MSTQVNVMVGGEAGQGVQSVGFILAKALALGGFHVFADQDYESRIRGGHNFYRVRGSDNKVAAIAETLDILVALNKETIDRHTRELSAKGVTVFDQDKVQGASLERAIGVPLDRLAMESAGDKMMANTVALGALLSLVHYDFPIVEQAVKMQFASDIGERNVRAARAGYDYVTQNYKGDFDLRLKRISSEKRMLLNGAEAIAIGAIAAGCKFMAAYPMTPATPIFEYIAGKADEYGVAVVPAEDEISAMNMTVGAAFAGVRAMTATSGSGFCLMTEGLGLAAITETPIVVVDAQRPGPAVGLPTRTEQGDLQFMLYAHQGDFPRVLLAPGTVEDCFWLTVKAFNLAEKYQVPVIILTDHHMATSYWTAEKFDISKVAINRGLLYSEQAGDYYQRYKITESGISPRAFPGLSKALVVADSDEHGEDGHMIEDGEIRTRIMDKRLRKLPALSAEIDPPKVYGREQADTLLIGWGSTYGAIREAADMLQKEELEARTLYLSELWPFPAASVASILDRAKRCYVIENNASGQMARLIRTETGKKIDTILKYDGRPFTPEGIVRAVKKGTA